MKISEAYVTEVNLIVSAKLQDHRGKLADGGQEQPLQLIGRILHKVSANRKTPKGPVSGGKGLESLNLTMPWAMPTSPRI